MSEVEDTLELIQVCRVQKVPKPVASYLLRKAFSELCVCLASYTASSRSLNTHLPRDKREPRSLHLEGKETFRGDLTSGSCTHRCTKANYVYVASSALVPLDKTLNIWKGFVLEERVIEWL